MAHRLPSIFHKKIHSANVGFPDKEGMPSHQETCVENLDALQGIQVVNFSVEYSVGFQLPYVKASLDIW